MRRKPHFLRLYQRQFSSAFWRLRQLRQVWGFKWKKMIFGLKQSSGETREKSQIFWELGRIILNQSLFAISIVWLLRVLDPYARELKFLSQIKVDDNAQLNFFSALLQISATLLGLYFTAVSVVASTAYARAPGDVRALIISEKVGSIYFKTLALFAGVLSLMVTALCFHWQVGLLNTLFATALSLFSVFCFVALGLRAFDFFNPAALVDHLNRGLAKSILAVQPGAYQWKDQSFQAHHQRQADSLLGSYANLVTIAGQKDNLNAKALIDLGIGLFSILSFYSSHKINIPTLSYWFKRNYSHKSWLLGSFEEVKVAMETSTSLRPDLVPDNLWFERRCTDILAAIVSHLSKRQEGAGVAKLSSAFNQTMETLGRNFCVEEGAFVFKRMTSCFAQTTGVIDKSDFSDHGRSDAVERLSAVELYSCGLMSFTLSLNLRIEGLDETFLLKCSDRNLSHPDATKDEPLPRILLQELESLHKMVQFETHVEGRRITQDWFLVESLAKQSAFVIVRLADELVTLYEEAFETRLKAELVNKNYFVLAQIIHRGLETCAKTVSALDIYEKQVSALILLDKSKDYAWPAQNWDILHERIERSRQGMIVMLAQIAGQLSELPENPSVPDYFGQAYALIADECFHALASNNLSLFKVFFPALVGITGAASGRIKDHLQRLPNPNLTLVGEPYLDLMGISGYAALYTDLHNDQFWPTVTEGWDRLLSLVPQPATGFVTALTQLTERGLFGSSSRDMLRFEWQRVFEDLLRERGILAQDYFFSGQVEPSYTPVTPLVRAFASSSHSLTNIQDLFLSRYVFSRPEAQGLAKPASVTDFESTLSRLESQTEHRGGDQDE